MRGGLNVEFIKKNPWVVLVGVFAILIAVGIAVS
jgi:hypothetical protein